MKLLLATRNKHKTEELAALLSETGVEVVTLDSFPGTPEVEEDQPTLEANASKKALACAAGSGLWALADDTGLEVEALGGAPGVFSARFAALDGITIGELAACARNNPHPACTYEQNNEKLLRAMKTNTAVGQRRAAFKTVMALAEPRGRVILEAGLLRGCIAARPRGSNGFGYDPVFELPQGKTLAELSIEEKNALSHRSAALAKMIPRIKRLALTLAAALILAAPVRAARTEPGQETIWDQIMAAQANRGLRLGSRYLDDKRYDLALKEFQRAVAANPKDPNAHMMLGVAYYWTGQVDQSLEEYRASLGMEPNNAQAWMLIGISLAWKGDEKGAYEAFKKSADIDPSRADIQMNLGSIEDSLNMVQDALGNFRKAASLAPTEPLYHYQLGAFYRKLGRDQEAGDELRSALKFYPEFEDALLELGAVDERSGDRKAAIHDFRRAVDLKSRDSVARLRLGRLYLLAGDPRKAREVFADAFHLTPEEGGPGLQLSIAYAGGKKQGPPVETNPGKPAEPAPDPSDPLNVFQRNLERVPLDQTAVMQVDVVFVPKPKLVKASPESPSSLKRALQQRLAQTAGAPQAVRREFALRAGSEEERAAQIAKIIEDLRGAMKNAPEDADVRLGMNLNFTRPTSAANGPGGAAGPGRADAGGESKVSYEPRQVGNDMGLWVIGTGWTALVEEILPEPGDKPDHPDQSDWWVASGLGYAAIGDGQRALSAFDRACSLDASNETALLGRGVAYVMTGNDALAIESFREAVKLNPKGKPAAEGLKWLLRPPAKAAAAKPKKTERQ